MKVFFVFLFLNLAQSNLFASGLQRSECGVNSFNSQEYEVAQDKLYNYLSKVFEDELKRIGVNLIQYKMLENYIFWTPHNNKLFLKFRLAALIVDRDQIISLKKDHYNSPHRLYFRKKIIRDSLGVPKKINCRVSIDETLGVHWELFNETQDHYSLNSFEQFKELNPVLEKEWNLEKAGESSKFSLY